MRKLAGWLAAALLLLSGCGARELPARETAADAPVLAPPRHYTDFFAEERVHDLYVEIAEEDWQAILATPRAKEYYSVTTTLDDVTIPDVGFRTRGNSSLRLWTQRGSERYPFRLKFDKYVDNQRFLGLDELVLTNSLDDPSFVREYLGYEAFRQLGLTVPYVTFFNLHINGELYGLYIGIEAVDNRFLNRAFGGHGGNLYEADLDATLTPEMDLETMEQKKGKDESKADVAELIRVLEEMPLGEKGGIERVLDVDGVLRTMAANAVLHNWDDYAGVFCHNYYLYAENGFFHLIPWDMNETFLQTGPMYRPSGGSRQDIATPIIGNVDPEERPLATKLMAVPEYYERYLGYCDTLRQWLETLPGTLTALSERIDSDVESDPTKFYSYEDFARQFDSAYHDGLAGFIKERAEYLSERLPELMAN